MPQPKLSGHFGGCLFWFVRWGEVAILFLRKVKNCQINGWKFTWNLPVICQEFMWFPNCTCKNMSSVARFITPFIWIGFTNSRQKSVPTCTKSFKTFQGLAKFKTKGISTNSARPKMFKEKTSKNHLTRFYKAEKRHFLPELPFFPYNLEITKARFRLGWKSIRHVLLTSSSKCTLSETSKQTWKRHHIPSNEHRKS